MRNIFNVRDWYWSVGNVPGVVFSSRRGAYVQTSDSDYTAWLVIHLRPTPIASEQELVEVLQQRDARDIVVPGTVGLFAYAKQKYSSVVSGGVSVNVGTPASPQMVAFHTDSTSLAHLQVTQTRGKPSVDFVDARDATVTLTAVQVTNAMNGVADFIQSARTTLRQVLDAIKAGTITSKALVDAPPAPIQAWPAN